MGPDHRVRRRVLAWLTAAALALGLLLVTGLPAADTAEGSVGQAGGSPGTADRAPAVAGRGPLAGKVIGIDPGHNGLNYTSPSFLNRTVWNGREREGCDTTGTRTAGGYTEASFTWNVAMYLRADLAAKGARVVLTRAGNHGLGPCVDRRARILNRAHANVSVDIHADYGPAAGRGFTILEPVADGPNNKVIGSSARFGRDVHATMLRGTAMGISDYYGRNGYITRDDLAGLNLTTMPKVLVECGNMRNAADAALLVRPAVQRAIAAALATAIVRFLTAP
jgi:N-acetylmuramoyl-L-alanine amidase